MPDFPSFPTDDDLSLGNDFDAGGLRISDTPAFEPAPETDIASPSATSPHFDQAFGDVGTFTGSTFGPGDGANIASSDESAVALDLFGVGKVPSSIDTGRGRTVGPESASARRRKLRRRRSVLYVRPAERRARSRTRLGRDQQVPTA